MLLLPLRRNNFYLWGSLRNGRRNQQRVAEFLQVIQQMVMPMPHSMLVSPSVRFADPIPANTNDRATLLTSIITRAKQNLAAVGVEPWPVVVPAEIIQEIQGEMEILGGGHSGFSIETKSQ